MSQTGTLNVRRILVSAVVIAVPAAILMSYWPALVPPQSDDGATDLPSMASGGLGNTPFIIRGIRTPTAVQAHEAELPDSERVIGVSLRGRFRAYRVKSMSTMASHVVNDLLDDVPVTVTYCDRTQRTRVFTGDGGGQPLDVDTGGYFHGLLLRVDGRFFRQDSNRFLDSGDAVLPELPFHEMSWGEWRSLHPETDVIVGFGSSFAKREEKTADEPK